MTMAMVVMMVSSVSAKNMSNRHVCGKQPVCTCCKHGDCKQDKCQPKSASFGGNRANKPMAVSASGGQRTVEVGRPQNAPQSPTVGKGIANTSQRSFGNMKRWKVYSVLANVRSEQWNVRSQLRNEDFFCGLTILVDYTAICSHCHHMWWCPAPLLFSSVFLWFFLRA